MKIKINIEIFDDTSRQHIEEAGLPVEILRQLYEREFDRFVEYVCQEGGCDYTLHVEAEDNTIQN